jgi:hypothetical protein
MSARDHVQGITNLKLFLTLFTIYHQAARAGCRGPVNLGITVYVFVGETVFPWFSKLTDPGIGLHMGSMG